MKKIAIRALALRSETIRALTTSALRAAQGAYPKQSAGGGCEQPTTQPDTHHTDTQTDLTTYG